MCVVLADSQNAKDFNENAVGDFCCSFEGLWVMALTCIAFPNLGHVHRYSSILFAFQRFGFEPSINIDILRTTGWPMFFAVEAKPVYST